MDEGYLILALDDRRYVELAINLALSFRRWENRPVSIVVSPGHEPSGDAAALFDRVITAQPDGALKGAMNKARLLDLTPYDRTMYVDADCLLFSPRIELFWHRYRGQPFVVEGHKQTTGPAFACSLGAKDAAELCAAYSLPYLTVFNAGVIYFERGPVAAEIFARVKALHAGPDRDRISYTYKHAGEYADEPFFGVVLGSMNIPPQEPPANNRLQVTTPNLVEAVMDIDTADLRIVKQTPGVAPELWAGVLCHFCGLSPMETYFELADKLRRENGLTPMDRGQFRFVVLTETLSKGH